jgi:hypothetical protein
VPTHQKKTKQVLYFDRYTRLLAPELDVLSDQRLQQMAVAAVPNQRQQPPTDDTAGGEILDV